MAVVLDPEGAVERPSADVANAGRPVSASARESDFASDSGVKKCPGKSARGLLAEGVARMVLTPDEDARVEAAEGEPVGFALRPAEAAKGRGGLIARPKATKSASARVKPGPANDSFRLARPAASVPRGQTAPGRPESREPCQSAGEQRGSTPATARSATQRNWVSAALPLNRIVPSASTSK